MSDPLDMNERGTRFRLADGAIIADELEEVIDLLVDRLQQLESRVEALSKPSPKPRASNASA